VTLLDAFFAGSGAEHGLVGEKAAKRFQTLMLRRMKWSESFVNGLDGQPTIERNAGTLVWQVCDGVCVMVCVCDGVCV
jgi:hypothetical protein